jgi:hypothetical protein
MATKTQTELVRRNASCAVFLESIYTTVEFLLLIGGQGERIALLLAEAVPELLDEIQPLVERETLNIDRLSHTREYPTSGNSLRPWLQVSR